MFWRTVVHHERTGSAHTQLQVTVCLHHVIGARRHAHARRLPETLLKAFFQRRYRDMFSLNPTKPPSPKRRLRSQSPGPHGCVGGCMTEMILEYFLSESTFCLGGSVAISFKNLCGLFVRHLPQSCLRETHLHLGARELRSSMTAHPHWRHDCSAELPELSFTFSLNKHLQTWPVWSKVHK